jgi:hypothetical protein
VYAYLSILTFLVQPTFSQDTSNEYKYSTIAESYGYADNQDNQEVSKMRELAYNSAKRNLLEKTMTHIKSYSKVENFVLEYDLVESESEGFLRIIEKKDLGHTVDNRYCVWIKAEVIYLFNRENMSQNTESSLNEPLSVKIWTEKEKYTLKERVKVFLLPNKNCYLKVIYNDADNNVLQIFPNQHKKYNFFKANKLYQIPDDSDSYEFTVSSPFGEERITVFASTSQLGSSQMNNYGPDFYKFDGNEQEYSFKTRGVKIINKEVPIEFFQESCKIVVEGK